MTSVQQFEGVLIAGAGPVGLTAALSLGQAGVPVRVLEAAHDTGREARASTFHAATLEMLDVLGVTDELLARGLVAPTFQYRNRSGGVIAELDMGVLSEDTRFPFRLQLDQSALTEVVHERLAAMSHVEVEFESRVVHAEARDSSAVVRVERASGAVEEIESAYLIGADGARSAVRESLGIDFEGVTYPERYLVAATSLDLRTWIPDLAYINYVADPQEWCVLLATPDGWRVLFPVAMDVADEDVIDEARVQGQLREIVDTGEPWPILYKQLYRVHQRLATTFNTGRICLAGDAAHLNNPLGGMGMNSGIHDAVALSSAVGGMFRSGHDAAALAAYSQARRKVVSTYVNRDTDANWSQLRESDDTKRMTQQEIWENLKTDRELERAFLLRASMLQSVRD